jgi:hypothetical protein
MNDQDLLQHASAACARMARSLAAACLSHQRQDAATFTQELDRAISDLPKLLEALSRAVPGLTGKPFEFGMTIGQYNPEYMDAAQEKIDGKVEYLEDVRIPLTIRYECGLRILLGEGPCWPTVGHGTPDVVIERQVNRGWYVLVAPDAGDPLTANYIYDDGSVEVQNDRNGITLVEREEAGAAK